VLRRVMELYLSLCDEGIMENRKNRIKEIIREAVWNQVNGELTPWDAEGREERFGPSNASRSQGSVPTREYIPRGYNDWRDNFKRVMSYSEYCKRFGLSI